MEQFIQQLLQDQGVPSDLEPEIRAELINELTDQATDFVNRRLINAMSDEVAEHFSTLLDEEPIDEVKIQEFITTNVPDRDKVVAQALFEFRALYLGDKA